MWLITMISWKSSLIELIVSTTRPRPRASCEPNPSSMIEVCSCAPARRSEQLAQRDAQRQVSAERLAAREHLVRPARPARPR